jgi:hypothetical protein
MRKDAVWDEIIHTEEKEVAKGIAKCEIKKTLCHEMYKNCSEKSSQNTYMYFSACILYHFC